MFWSLLIIIFISSLPVIAVFIWLRRYQFSLYQFLFALLAGATAFFPALLLQNFLSVSLHNVRAAMFYHHFIQIALTEEISRLLMLLLFFWISARFPSARLTNARLTSAPTQPLSFNIIKKATAVGLAAGLGFALLENAVYAASDINTLPLRVITAAIHGACGSRIGAAVVLFRHSPMQAILRILTATVIHGIYNMMVTMPGISSIAAILIALSAFLTAIISIRGGWSENPNTHTPAIDKKDDNP